MTTQMTIQERISGLLLGGAVGDGMGLPAEGMSAERIARRWPGELKHRFVLGRGMISDDTEHAAMTAQALIVAAGDVEKFRRSLAWKLRWWFLGLPAAALAVAEAAAWIVRGDSREQFQVRLPALSEDGEWLRVCKLLADGLSSGQSVKQFAEVLGLKSVVTGYAFHTVPVALFAWLRHRGDYRETIQSVIRCGGDTDTAAAIAGSLAGCDSGRVGIPGEWLDNLKDWPRSKEWLGCVALRLTESDSQKPVRLFWPGIIPRNLFFLATVLVHGLRRILPPY
ncbi:MAG: ADP-ribosylglycohydrolase family protein [Verrucomicrobia bacterium]|nr:ADP-ribosylglycohydrolase family protein [Verrucomicrobiota bacterium]